MADARSDSGELLTRSQVSEAIRSAMTYLQGIATTGDARIDDDMLEAEQALRRVRARLSNV